MRISKEQKILILLGAVIGTLYFCFSTAIVLTFSELILGKQVFAKAAFFLFGFPALISLSFVISAFGILYHKRWAFRLNILATILVWLSSLKILFLISYHSVLGISDILLLILSGFVFWFSFKKTTREQFGEVHISANQEKFRKFNRIFGYFFITLTLIAIGYYAFNYFVVYPSQKVACSVKNDAYLSRNYVKRNIFNLSLFVPKDARIISMQKTLFFGDKGHVLFMADTNDTVRITVNLDPLGGLYKYLGYRNSYELHRRINRFVHFISSNFLRDSGEKIIAKDISAGESLEGFLTIFPAGDKKIIYEYRLYDKRDKNITGSIHFLVSKDADININDIIGSLELRSISANESQDFIREGTAFLTGNQYEEAKFSLVNALYSDWDNPEYNYYLGASFYKTGNYSAARYFLEKSQKYSDAQILIEQIKNKGE